MQVQVQMQNEKWHNRFNHEKKMKEKSLFVLAHLYLLRVLIKLHYLSYFIIYTIYLIFREICLTFLCYSILRRV